MLCLKTKATGIRLQNSIKNNCNAAFNVSNANIRDPRKYINFPLLQNLQAEKNILQISEICCNLLGGWPKIKHFKLSKALNYSYKKLFFFPLDLSPLPRNSVQGPSTTHWHSSFSLFPQQESREQLGWDAALRCCICWNTLCPRWALAACTHFPLFKQITCSCPMHLSYPKITQS